MQWCSGRGTSQCILFSHRTQRAKREVVDWLECRAGVGRRLKVPLKKLELSQNVPFLTVKFHILQMAGSAAVGSSSQLIINIIHHILVLQSSPFHHLAPLYTLHQPFPTCKTTNELRRYNNLQQWKRHRLISSATQPMNINKRTYTV